MCCFFLADLKAEMVIKAWLIFFTFGALFKQYRFCCLCFVNDERQGAFAGDAKLKHGFVEAVLLVELNYCHMVVFQRVSGSVPSVKVANFCRSVHHVVRLSS